MRTFRVSSDRMLGGQNIQGSCSQRVRLLDRNRSYESTAVASGLLSRSGTMTLGSMGGVSLELDYAESGKADALRCNNGSGQNASVRICGVDDSGTEFAVYQQTFAPGLTVMPFDALTSDRIVPMKENQFKPGKQVGVNTLIKVPG
jgi:hypothetical protein